MIVIKRVSVVRKGKTILKDVNLRIEPKECVCILGNSGNGKTVLFELFSKTTDPTSGTVEVDGVALTLLPPSILQLYRRRLGIIFQEPQLLGYLTVRENIAFPLELRGTDAALTKKRTAELLKRLGLTAKADLLPEALSQSERALTGIARAFAGNPLILLADEPLQSLDRRQMEAVLDLFVEAKAQGVTIILCTRDSVTAEILGARTLILDKGIVSEQAQPRELRSLPASPTFSEPEPAEKMSIAHELPASPRGRLKEKGKIRITSISS